MDCARLGTEPVSQPSQDATDPFVPEQAPLPIFFILFSLDHKHSLGVKGKSQIDLKSCHHEKKNSVTVCGNGC